jgi:hypothetical protein
LEAASVLVTMKSITDDTTPPDSAKDFQSDQESASPAASGSSEQHEETSSADTTPPPQGDLFNTYGNSYGTRPKRYSSGSGFSRSYQSAPSAHSFGSFSSAMGHYRQPSHERRPPSSGIAGTGQDDEDLANALGLLSGSFGSNTAGSLRNIPVTLPEDAPPVPDIPARYLNEHSFSGATLTPNQHPRQVESYERYPVHDADVKMEESEESVGDDDDFDHHSRGRSDEEDEGVFGRMEE